METFDHFIHKLKTQLTNPLPGQNSQMKMSPITRKMELDKIKRGRKARESAVLILFYPHQNETFTVFIKRPTYPGVHSGQVAFPGGKFEEEDQTLITTALREAHEEIGIIPKEVYLLGKLTKLFIPPSNFNVLPVLAYLKKRPEFISDPFEVDEIIEVKLDQLLNPVNNQTREILHRSQKMVKVPAYCVNEQIIWGATAMIINELIEVIKS